MNTKLLLLSMTCAIAIHTSAQPKGVRYEDFIVTDSSNIYQGVLDNGFRYYICNNSIPYDKLEMRLIQKTGTNHDDGIPGISLLLKRMLSSREVHLSEGASYTSEIEHKCTEFSLLRLNDEHAYADSCMEILADIAGAARFSVSELERQKELLATEISNKRYNLTKAEEDYIKAVFVYGCTPDEWINKQVESIRSITIQQLEAYYQKWYAPQNQCLYVFGKAPVDIVDMIKQKFGSRPSMPAPKKAENILSDNKLMMLKYDSFTFNIKFWFMKPRTALSETRNLDYLRKTVIQTRFCDILKSYFGGFTTASIDETDKLFERPLLEINCIKGIELYGDENQFTGFIDDITKKLYDIMHNELPINMDTLSIEKQKELQQQALTDIRRDVVLDTYSCIKENFINSTPLIKRLQPYNYFQHEITKQDILDYCKEVFSNYDLKIVCVTPYDYPDADIKAKLESVVQRFSAQ